MTATVRAERRYLAILAARTHDLWSVDQGIDWELPTRPPRWLPARLFTRALSQLYHGEVATAALCRRLGGELAANEPEASLCLIAQADDEARHADVFARYLARLGDMAPFDPPLEQALSAASALRSTPVAAILAYNLILEGEALQLLQAFAHHIPCPLLAAVVRRTGRDEARHVAFGDAYVKAAVEVISAAEREALIRQIRDLWQECVPALLSTYAGPFGDWIGRGAADRRFARHAPRLARLGLPVE